MFKALITEFPLSDVPKERTVTEEKIRKYTYTKEEVDVLISNAVREAVEEAKKRFQEDDQFHSPVIVLSIQAAKTGHTLTSAQDILFIEMPWTPADVDQTYSRLHRIGQEGSVTATYMLTAGTVDEEIYDLIEEKRKVVDLATEGEMAELPDGTAGAVKVIDSLLNQNVVA